MNFLKILDEWETKEGMYSGHTDEEITITSCRYEIKKRSKDILSLGVSAYIGKERRDSTLNQVVF